MNLKLISLILIFSVSSVEGQDFTKKFSVKNFPPEQFQLIVKTYPFHSLTLKFINVKDIRKNNGTFGECHIYLKMLRGTTIIKEKWIGEINTEDDVALPKIQPLENYFMINYIGEWNGEITLIDTTGKMIKFTGSSYAISKDKKYLFTKAKYPSILFISRFNILTENVLSKEWNHLLKEEPWKEVSSNEYIDDSVSVSFSLIK